MEKESLAWMQSCSFCAVYQGPDAKRRGACFSWSIKNNFPSYTNGKAKRRIYCIVSRVLTLHYKEWVTIENHSLYIFYCIVLWHKERKSTANYLICMVMNIFCFGGVFVMVYLFSCIFFVKEKKKEYAWHKIGSNIVKTRKKKKTYEPAARSRNHAATPAEHTCTDELSLSVWITNQHTAMLNLWLTLFKKMGRYLEVR